VKAVCVGTGVSACLALLLYHLDRAIVLTTVGRLAALLTLAGAAIATLAAALLGPRLRALSDTRLALWAERRFPDLRERLLTAVELQAYRADTSSELADALTQDAAAVARQLDMRQVVPIHGLRRPAAFAAAALTALLAQAALTPLSVANWLQRVLDPFSDIPIWAQTRVYVAPGNARVARNDGVALTIRTEGAPASAVTLFLRSGSGPWEQRRLRQAGPTPLSGRFMARVPALQDDLSYYARANDGVSNRYRITVEDRPVVRSVAVTITYPAYMARSPSTTHGSTANTVAPVGSVARFILRANKPLAGASMTVGGAAPTCMDVSGDEATASLTLVRDMTARVSLKDAHGFRSQPDPEYSIRTIRDRPPVVRVTSPNADVERAPRGTVRIVAEARDDYGVGSMRLQHGRPGAIRTSDLPLRRGNGPGDAYTAFDLRLPALGLRPGDIVTYRVAASDRDNVSGPNVGRSAEYRVRIVSDQEMRERIESAMSEHLAQLSRLALMERAVESRLANRRAAPDRLRAAAAEQRAVAARTAELRAAIAQTAARAAENGIATEREQAHHAALARELGAMTAGAMPRAAAQMEEAARLMSQASASAEQAREVASTQATGIRQSLERLANQNAPPASPAELAREAVALAQAQQSLADRTQALSEQFSSAATREGAAPSAARAELAAQQAGLRDRTTALSYRVETAAANDQTGATRRAAQAFAAQDVPSRQTEAQRQVSAGDPGAAVPEQTESARALQRLASDLLTGETTARTSDDLNRQAETLGRLADQLTDLSNKQRAIQQAAERRPSADEAARIAGDERGLEATTRRMLPSLAPAPAAADAASRAANSMQRASRSLSANNAPEATPPARQAVRDLLQAAMEAREASRLLETQADALEAQRAVEALARDQRRLERQTSAAHVATSGKDDATVTRQAHALAPQQDQLGQRLGKTIEGMPTEAMKWMGWQAQRRMGDASGGLWRKDMGPATRRSQSHAAQTLERLAASLEQQRLSAALQQEAGDRGSPEHQMAESAGEIRAMREMQAQIQAETASLESRRSVRSSRQLTEPEARETSQLAEAEVNIKDRLRAVADRTREAVAEAEALRQVSESVKPIESALRRQETGPSTQERQRSVVNSLDTILGRNREELASSVRRATAGRGRQADARSERAPGSRNAPIVSEALSRFRPPATGTFRFGGLSAREQQLLQQGRLDRVPPEYRDLVNRYYRALSERH